MEIFVPSVHECLSVTILFWDHKGEGLYKTRQRLHEQIDSLVLMYGKYAKRFKSVEIWRVPGS